MGFCENVGWPSKRVQIELSKGFHWLGGFAARRPFVMIFIGIFIAVVCGFGINLLEEDNVVFYMPSSRASKDERLIESTFGDLFNSQRSSRLIIIASDNILEGQTLVSAYDIHARVINDITVEDNSEVITFQDVCVKQGNTTQCAENDFFAVLGLSNRDEVANVTANISDVLSDETAQLLGGIVNNNGDITKAKALQLVYFEYATAETIKWEEAFIDYFQNNKQEIIASSNGIEEINYYNLRGEGNETKRIVDQEIPMIAAAFGLILIYMCLILGGRPFVRSRFILGLSCLITVALSFVFSLGLCGYFGVKFTTISILAGFVLLGVGVDDMIIIVDALQRTDPLLGTCDAVAEAMKEAGLAITISSFSSFVAFLIASSIDLLAIRYFGILAGLGILGVYVIQITFFLGILVLDERRMRANRVDCLPCVQLPTNTSAKSNSNIQTLQDEDKAEERESSTGSSKEAVKPVEDMTRDAQNVPLPTDADPTAGKNYQPSLVRYFLVKILTLAIARTWFRVVIILLFVGLLAGMIYSTTQLSSDTDITDLHSDDSFLKPYFQNLKTYYAYALIPCQFLVFGVQPFDATVRQNLEGVRNQLLELPFMSRPVSYWADAMTLWEQQIHNGTEIPEDYETGLQHFSDFIRAAPFNATLPDGTQKQVFPSTYQYDIVPYQNQYATRMFMFYGQSSASSGNIDNLKELRGILDSASSEEEGVVYVVWQQYFKWYDRDALIVNAMIQSLVYAALGIFASLLIFVHPATAVFVGATVVCIDICLLGLMSLWGIELNVASFICVAMALGLSVDYLVHITINYVASPGTPRQKLILAYSDMGTSIFNGGFSTFLGILLLAFTQSNAFRLVFKVMFAVVVFGMLFGLLLVPAILYQFFIFINYWQNTSSQTRQQDQQNQNTQPIQTQIQN